MSRFARKDVLSLSIAERIELIGDLWDSMAEVPEAVTLAEAQNAEPDCRLDADRPDSLAGRS
jgi:putative addiction module component (TIGR02574 family)